MAKEQHPSLVELQSRLDKQKRRLEQFRDNFVPDGEWETSATFLLSSLSRLQTYVQAEKDSREFARNEVTPFLINIGILALAILTLHNLGTLKPEAGHFYPNLITILVSLGGPVLGIVFLAHWQAILKRDANAATSELVDKVELLQAEVSKFFLEMQQKEIDEDEKEEEEIEKAKTLHQLLTN